MGPENRPNVRRRIGRALAIEPDEMRRRRRHILPPRGDRPVPLLRLDSAADARAAPTVIVAAFLADEVTAEEAIELLKAVEQVRFAAKALKGLTRIQRGLELLKPREVREEERQSKGPRRL